MKKLWQQYSFVMILLTISFATALILTGKLYKSEEYLRVTVEEGESLWKIAEKYSDGHSMSMAEFVSWVEKENGKAGKTIFPGEQLVVPVLEKNDATKELTAFAGE